MDLEKRRILAEIGLGTFYTGGTESFSVVDVINSLRKGVGEFLKIPVDREKIDRNLKIGAEMRKRYVAWVSASPSRSGVRYKTWRVKYSGMELRSA